MFPSYNYSKILFFEVPYHRQSHRDGMSKKGWRKPAFCMKRPCRRGRSGKWMKIPDRTSLNIWGKHIPMVLWWLLAVNSLPVFLRNHESQLKLKSKRYIVRRSDRCHLDLFICGFVQENYQQNNDVLKFYGNMWYTLYIYIYSIYSICTHVQYNDISSWVYIISFCLTWGGLTLRKWPTITWSVADDKSPMNMCQMSQGQKMSKHRINGLMVPFQL